MNPIIPFDRDQQFVNVNLQSFNIVDLKAFHQSLTGRAIGGSKATIIAALSRLLTFNSQADFDHFYRELPPVLQEAIAIGSFFRLVNIEALEKKTDIVVVKSLESYWNFYQPTINPATRLQIFTYNDEETLFLPKFFRLLFLPWLPKPPDFFPMPLDEVRGRLWSNVDGLVENLPLLIEALTAIRKNISTGDLIRKGLTKTRIRELRAACGLAEFNIGGSLGLDSIELFTRALLCLEQPPSKRPSDIEAYIKKLLWRFFEGADPRQQITIGFGSGQLEYFALIDHLTRRPTTGYFSLLNRPEGRLSFKALLTALGQTSAWYDAEQICKAALMQGHDFVFSQLGNEGEYLHLKGQILTIGDESFSSHGEVFPVDLRLRDRLLVLPLFKAYCYLLAVLGVIEITEIDPPKALIKKQKPLAISPYDGLCCFRITDFGAWCLELRKDRPKRQAVKFEAIADKALLLVAFKGQSLERKLFLEQIGLKLGEDRYRITEASFIRGCTDKAAIGARIAKFRSLIDPNPAAHWEAFFTSLITNTDLFDTAEVCWLFSLPTELRSDGQTALRSILSDPLLRKMVVRAEGQRLVVRFKDYRPFIKAMAERGFLINEL